MNQKRRLIIFDTKGKKLVQIGEAFDNFDQLIELVTSRIDAKPDDTADTVQLAKARRTALMAWGVGGLMICSGLGIAYGGYRQQRAERLLSAVGMAGEAEIIDRFIAPNGVTPRLEYKITTEDGLSAERNAELARPAWDALAGASHVDVVYVPGEPSISRVAHGEVVKQDFTNTPQGSYILGSLSVLVAALMVAAGVLQWKGWDVDVDSKTGKVSIQRFGAGR